MKYNKYEFVEVNSKRWFDLTPLLNEEFRPVKDYEGLYEVSNYGRVKSLERYVYKRNKYKECQILYRERILLQVHKDRNYWTVALYKQNKREDKKVHRLVSEVFLNEKEFKSMPDENREKFNLSNLQVNHRDENASNNCVDNLEFCTRRYNCNYGTRIERIYQTKKKKGVVK